MDNHAEKNLRAIYKLSYEPQKLRGKASDTKRQYHFALQKFERFLEREPVPSDLTDETVNGLLAWMADNDWAPRTINNCRSYILALWRFMARKGIVPVWPDVDPQPEPTRIPSGWNKDQLTLLIESCRVHPGMVSGIPAGKYWTGLHYVWWNSGERRSATLDLRWEWLDWSTGDLLVPAEVRKGKRKPMLYRLQSYTLDALREIESPMREMIFPWDKHVSSFYNHYTRILKRAGLPSDRYCKPQKMRRSFASHLEAAGGNATAALNHAARRTTEQSYLDPRIVGHTPASDSLFPL